MSTDSFPERIMSGHSHWATIKRKKAATDAKKNKVFSKMARAIMVAAKDGGGDPDLNIKLLYAVNDAKAVNMPKENIERAIKRGTGESGAANFEEITYEGYGPNGTAVLIETLTDNRNRTAPEIRKIFESNGGKMGGANSVGYLFQRKGVIRIPADSTTEDDLMEAALDAGAENLEESDDAFEITTGPAEFDTVRKALEEKFRIESSEIMRIPKMSNKVDAETGRKLMELMDAFDENDDVQKVYTDSEPPEDLDAS